MKALGAMVVLVILAVPFASHADEFYGLSFGDSKEKVGRIFKINTQYGLNSVEQPGHEMKSLYFRFDNKQQLFHIEAYYPLGESNEKHEAVLQAVTQRFVDPLNKRSELEVKTETHSSTDRYGTSRLLVLRITSKPHRQAYIEFLKNDLLQRMR